MESSKSYILIGSDHSLYTGKLRAYLTYKGIPFEQMTASLQTYKQVILPRTGVAFIPVLVCPDHSTVLQDTHAIMQQLEQQHPCSPILPTTSRQALSSKLLELYGDEWLLLPAMHYRWSFPEQQQLMHYQFGSTNAPTAPYQQQLEIGCKVASRFSSMLQPLGINAASVPVIEARFRWQLAVLQQHLQEKPFLLSESSPCSAEFGLIGPLFAHLYRDPVPSCIIKCQAPLVASWIEQVAGVAGSKVQAGYSPIVGLKPENPAQPGTGVLKVQRAARQQRHQLTEGQLQGTAASSTSSSSSVSSSSSSRGSSLDCHTGCNSGLFLSGDVVPDTLLPLLHHMFQEQMPVIHSTLKLLKAWIDQEQQQKQQQPVPSSSSSQQSHRQAGKQASGEGWLVVPRSLGFHSFTLFDPVTGQAAFTGQRSGSSYVAWRAALIAAWFEGLSFTDQVAVMQLLQQVGASGGPGSMFYTAAATTAAAVVPAVPAGVPTGVNGPAAAAAAAALPVVCAAASSAGTTGSGGNATQRIDAAAAFVEMLRLVGVCGHISRAENRIVVKPSGAVTSTASTVAAAAAAAAATRTGGGSSLSSKL